MKLKVTKTTVEEIEVNLPAYTKDQYGFYKIYESAKREIRVINCSPSLVADLLHSKDIEKEACTAAEFYEAFARTMQRLKDITGIEMLPLDDNDSDRFNADEASELKEKNDWDSQMDGIR